jgi:hypothetical protein
MNVADLNICYIIGMFPPMQMNIFIDLASKSHITVLKKS